MYGSPPCPFLTLSRVTGSVTLGTNVRGSTLFHLLPEGSRDFRSEGPTDPSGARHDRDLRCIPLVLGVTSSLVVFPLGVVLVRNVLGVAAPTSG